MATKEDNITKVILKEYSFYNEEVVSSVLLGRDQYIPEAFIIYSPRHHTS